MDDREIKESYLEKRAAKVVKNLRKNGFKAKYLATAGEAKDTFLSLIPEGVTVAIAGGQTLEQIGVRPYLLQSGKFHIINPGEPGIDAKEALARRKKTLTADVMVCGTNAVTENGLLVNVDGWGQRVAGMIFGPDKVIIGAGMNKVVEDIPDAWQRLRRIARPMNNIRYGSKNPCTDTGFCADCNNKTRICNYFTIMERSFILDRIHVILIGEDLGY